MTEVSVDTEKLAYGLKRGIGRTETIFAEGPFDYRLRLTACGLAATAIHRYCQEEEIYSRLLISSPRLDFDVEMQHVVPVVGDAPDEGLVIDAAYSQFLNYVGMGLPYDEANGSKEYPKEEIITFKFSERELITHWLTDYAVEFQRRNQHPRDEHGVDMGNARLVDADEETIRQAYDSIWDPDNMQPWNPPEHVVQHASHASAYIPPGAISY